MQVADIKCFCKGTDTGEFLKPDEYQSVLSSLDDFKTNLDSTKTTVDGELSSGGLNASALNFSGFSPLFEMGYQASKNVDLATSSIDEVKSSIEDDANVHLTNEWGKFYQEVHKCTEEKKKAMESAKSNYEKVSSNKDSTESQIASAKSAYNSAKEDYENHKEKEAEASGKYESYAGSGSAASALSIDFVEASKTGNYVDINTGEPVSELDIPDSVKQSDYYTVTGYDFWCQSGDEMVWSAGTNQRAVSDLWKAQGSRFKHGIAVINVDGVDRYLVATASTLGEVGDMINCTLADGTVVPCIVADQKSSGDSNYTKYGHAQSNGTVNVLEMEVQRSAYLENGNVTTKSYGLEWDSSSPVAHVDNYGSVLGNNNHTFSSDEGAAIGGAAAGGVSSQYKSLNSMSQANKRTAETTSVKAKTRTFKGGSSGVVQDAIDWGLGIANDDSYGYSQNRGDHEYDCSSLAIAMYKNAGVDVGGATYTGNMRECMTSTGNFEWIPGDPDPSTLQPGDIVLDESSHTEIYIGDGKLLGAHDNFSGGAGDPSGEEIDVGNYYSHPWDGVLRYKG